MDEPSPFDLLVASLSREERRDLLERLRRSAPLSGDPLFVPEEPAEECLRAPEERIAALGLLQRLILFLKKTFSGRSYRELLLERDLRRIAAELDTRAPGLADARRELVLEGLHAELKRLKDAARYFYDLLERTVDRDKGAFVAFLASIELPDTHARLLAETDPLALSEARPELDEEQVRGTVLGALESILSGIPEERRKTMYAELRSVLFLKKLSGFLFDRLLLCFRPGAGGLLAAPFSEVRELLSELSDTLHSLALPPSAELVEAMTAFAAREELFKEGPEVEDSLRGDMAKAGEALTRIRAFGARVPFDLLMRLVTGEIRRESRSLPGGEDWLALYRAFWKARVEAALSRYQSERRFRALAAEIASFVGPMGAAMGSLGHVAREGSAESPPVRQELALAFIDALVRGPLLGEFARPLRIVLVDGEFYKKENRIEFTDAYNSLHRMAEELSLFDRRLSAEGELGQAWIQARGELVPLPTKRRRIQLIERGVEEEAEGLVRKAAGALARMVSILRGVLKGEAGGRYDSLSNLSFLDGKSNRDFLKSLDRVKDRMERALALLGELSGLQFERRD